MSSPTTTATGNETVLDQAVARWNAGDLDGYLDLYDPGVRLHGYTPEAMDRTEVAQFYAGIVAAFPGCSLTLHETFADGERLVCRFTLAGRHDGPFLGVPATGREIAMAGITILHFRAGRCVERWSCADMLGVLVQIGAVPAGSPSR
jgi:predicted ester cyclase